MTFADGAREDVDVLVCATGYELDIPYLPTRSGTSSGATSRLHQRTLHPDLPGFGVVGQFLAQGPYFPLLELQARWIVATWAGEVAPPDAARMRRGAAEPRPPLDPHNVLAIALAEELGVAPDLRARPELAEPLLFGPLLPPRYRLDGPGAQPDAAERFAEQLAASPRAPVDPADVEALRGLGLGDVADRLLGARVTRQATGDDLERAGALRRGHLHHVARPRADEHAADGGVDGEPPRRGVGVHGGGERVAQLAAACPGRPARARSEAGRLAAAGRVDDLGAQELVAQAQDLRLQHRLGVLRVVVLRVLLQVAPLAGDPDPLGDLRAGGRLQLVQLRLERAVVRRAS